MKYTYEDIIIDPNDKRLEGAVGKEVYLETSAIDVLKQANGEDGPNILMAIHKDEVYPFQGIKFRYPFAILKKEPKVKYVPFDLSKEEDRAFLRGKWVKKKDTGNEHQLIHFTHIDNLWRALANTGQELYDYFTFLDGTPVGKKVEE